MEILTGVRSGSLSSLSMATSPFSAPAPGPERQILVNEDAQRPSGANGDGGLDVEVLGHDLLTGLGGGLLGRLTNGAHEIALIVADRQFGADAKQGRKHDALEHLPAMEDRTRTRLNSRN